MATNYHKDGRVVDWTNATGSAVASGIPAQYGLDQMGVVLVTTANAAVGSMALDGEFGLVKHTDAVAVAGQPAYWLTDKCYDAPGLGRQYIGVFAAGALATVLTCRVQLRPFIAEGPRLLALTLSANLAVTAPDLVSGELSLLLSNAAPRVVTLPSVATIPRGAKLRVRKTGGGAGALTLTSAAPETIAGNATHATIDADNDHALFQSTGAAWLLLDSTIA